MAEAGVVHPDCRRGVRRPHGGRARPLCRTVSRPPAGRLLRRGAGAVDWRTSRAAPHAPGHARADRLRVYPPGHLQRVRARESAARVAASDGHRASRERGLRAPNALARRRGLPDGAAYLRRPRQPEYAQTGSAVRDLPAGRSAATAPHAGVPLHAAAWELADYGRTGAQLSHTGLAWSTQPPHPPTTP